VAKLADADVTIALGSAPNDLIAAAANVLTSALGRPAVLVEAHHEVYLTDPSVLTSLVNAP
jgi:hypothetical protein